MAYCPYQIIISSAAIELRHMDTHADITHPICVHFERIVQKTCKKCLFVKNVARRKMFAVKEQREFS
jgi:hypothetical protein